MAVNRFNQLLPSQRYISTAIPLPFDDILKAGMVKQTAQDQANLERMQLLGKTWNRLPGDRDRSIELQNEINSTLANFADKDFNDPKVRSEWYKTKVDLARQFSPNGEIGAQQANYDAYKAYEKELLDKSKDLGWSTEQLQTHLNDAKNAFKTRGESGDLAYFQGRGLPTRVNTTKWLKEVLPLVADDTGISKLRKYGSLNEVTDAFVKDEINHLDYNKIVNSLSKLAQGDSELMSSLEQEGLFRGKSGWSNFIKSQDKDGNVTLDTSTPFGAQLAGLAQAAQFQKLKEEYIKVDDKLGLYEKKKAIDNQELQRQMQWTIQGRPTDPNNPTNNDAGVNVALENSNNPLKDHWELRDGKLTMKDFSDIQETININGKTYNPVKDALPPGYSYAGPGKVQDITGKIIKTTVKNNAQDEQFKGFQELANIANRLGIKGNREQVQQGVEDYLKNANNFQMNFTKFDEGTKAALSKAWGVKAKLDDSGELVIADPGELSFSTLKTLDGKPLTGDDIMSLKSQYLNGAKILGPAQSLTNSNYEAGDMYIQTKDNGVMIMNSNNQTVKDALTPSNRLTQSIDRYVNTGERSINPSDLKVIEHYLPNKNVTGVEQNAEGDHYVSFIDNNIPKVMKLIETGDPKNPVRIEFLGLDEANKQLDASYMKPIIPSYNTQNFNKITKSEELDTE